MVVALSTLALLAALADAMMRAGSEGALRSILEYQTKTRTSADMKQLIPIRYIGIKLDHEDVLYGTGLKWKPGEVKSVPREVAQWMLTHADVYEDARRPAVQEKDPIVPQPRVARGLDIEQDIPAANLAHMGKKDLALYNFRAFGERIDADKMTAQQMREHIRANMRMRLL